MRQGAWRADHHRHNNVYHDHHAQVPYEQCSTKYRNQCKKVPQQKCVTLKDLKCTDVWVEVTEVSLVSFFVKTSKYFLYFSSGAQDQKQEIVLLGRKKAPGQVLLQKVKYSKYSNTLQICWMHQITKISSVASNEIIESLFCSNNENIESLFCSDRIMTSCSTQPLTTRRISNTLTALWRFLLSGLIQTSFD